MSSRTSWDSRLDRQHAVDQHRPDITLVDIRLPPTFGDEGIQAVRTARRTRPDLPVLVLSQYVERAYAVELLADGRGSIGYLLKDRIARLDGFLDAMRRVATGGTAVDPQVISQLVAQHPPSRLGKLSPR